MRTPESSLATVSGPGFELPVPVGWELADDLPDGVAVIAVEPTAAAGFRANAVLTVEPLPRDVGLESWQETVDAQLARELPHFLLIDRETVGDGGRRLMRRLGHHIGGETGPVTMEQWAIVVGDNGYTLTASVATPAYDSLADVFADMAEGLYVRDEERE